MLATARASHPRRDRAAPGILDYDQAVIEHREILRAAALIPVRALEGAKSRLGEALDAEERRGLVERLLRATVAAAAAVPAVAAVGVISGDPAVLALAEELGATPLLEPPGERGLNDALGAGARWAVEQGADAILAVPGDLPAISAEAIEAVLAAAAPGPRASIVLVPDRLATGTNMLLVAPPAAIPFHFGDRSRAAHAAAAAAAGASYREVEGPLTLDLDTPDDLLAAEAAGLLAAGGEVPA